MEEEIGTATLENHLAVFSTAERMHLQPNNSTPRYTPRESVHVCRIFKEALIIIAPI